MPGGAGGGGGRERVGDVEAADQREADDRIGCRCGGRRARSACRRARRARRRRDRRRRASSSTRVASTTSRPASRARAASSPPRSSSTLTAAAGVRTRREQARLRREVRVERAVVVEVLVAQVGEAHRREVHAVDPMLSQRVRRHLHRDRGARRRRACARAAPGGRSPRAWCAPVGIVVRPRPAPRRCRSRRRGRRRARGDRLEEIGGGRLAVRAGDAEHPHRRRRVAVTDGPPAGRARRGRRRPGPGPPSSGRDRSTSSATAPRATASGGVVVPVGRRRRGCTRSTRPGVTWRLSWVMAAISTSRIPGEPGRGGLPRPVETGEQVVPTHACGVLSARSRD